MTDVQVIMTEPNKYSAPFTEMAQRISRNLEGEFAGAMLIVPPVGEPIAVMMTDPKQDLEAFLAMCSGKVQIAVAEHQISKQGSGAGWPARR